MKMKKFFNLMAMVCSIGLLASCGGDDEEGGGSGPSGKRLPAIEGTWNVWSQGDDINGYKGSAQITWEVVDDAKINIDLGTGTAMPIPIKTTLVPLANSMANKFLPSLLKSVTFAADGQINAMVAGDIDDGHTLWRSINGYSSYTVINDQLIISTSMLTRLRSVWTIPSSRRRSVQSSSSIAPSPSTSVGMVPTILTSM